jgi:thiol-disulfide isomerase/thioredoxin
MSRQNGIIAGVAGLALVVGLGMAVWLKAEDPGREAAAALLKTALTDLQNQPTTLEQYRGKVLVVNFWATWCAPCREEIPYFVQIQSELAANDVQFAGIAVDDAVRVAAFVKETGLNYPTLIGGSRASEAMRSLGNPSSGLPFTLIYDRSGKLREKILGGVDEQRLRQMLDLYI